MEYDIHSYFGCFMSQEDKEEKHEGAAEMSHRGQIVAQANEENQE